MGYRPCGPADRTGELKDAGYKVPEINMKAYMKVRSLIQEFMDDFLGLYISPKNRLMNSLLIGPGPARRHDGKPDVRPRKEPGDNQQEQYQEQQAAHEPRPAVDQAVR